MSEKIAPPPAGSKLSAAEAQAFLSWLRSQAQDAAFHAGLKRFSPR